MNLQEIKNYTIVDPVFPGGNFTIFVTSFPPGNEFEASRLLRRSELFSCPKITRC
jgi:hypothetical protein